jgi:hypothetical protein
MSGDTKKSCPHGTTSEAISWAAENNLDVFIPNDRHLLIDIDRDIDRRTFERNRDLIETSYGIENISESTSRSGGTHITVTLRDPITAIERIALQAVLGSDRRREAHSLRRWFEGELHPTIFFEKKPA